jgi:hypothetical protein
MYISPWLTYFLFASFGTIFYFYRISLNLNLLKQTLFSYIYKHSSVLR